VTSADVNSDGKLDLIIANGQSNTVSVLIDSSTGFSGYPTTTETITINGTNDAPIVDPTEVTGAVTGLVMPIGNLTDSGTINFTDVDLADNHSISSVAPSSGALGTLIPTVTADTTGTGVGGIVTWNYSVAASAVEYLAEGKHKVETFTVRQRGCFARSPCFCLLNNRLNNIPLCQIHQHLQGRPPLH
jgi:VCBS repeat-containing protein